MKLALITAFPPSKITLNEYGYHLVKHFVKKDEITELLLLTDKTEGDKALNFDDLKCKLSVHECWSFNSLFNIMTVVRTLFKTKPDAVLLNLQFLKFGDKKLAAALGLLLPLACKFLRIPNVVLLHNIMETVDLESAGFSSNALVKKTYAGIGTVLTRLILQADCVALTIQKYVKILEQKYKVKNLYCIPHGTFELAENPSFNLPYGPLQIMTFGKFGTYKKVENMIEAVELVRNRTNTDLEIVIAGTDNPNVPGYLEAVKKKYAHIEQLRFTGYVAEEDVAKLFRDSAVVVFPYTSTTGSSGVLHQAGSYGKAVVMPDLGDLSELVMDEGYVGEFFEPSCVSSLAMAIEKIAIDEQYRTDLGRINYKAATAFPMSRITDIYLEKINELLKRKRPVASKVDVV